MINVIYSRKPKNTGNLAAELASELGALLEGLAIARQQGHKTSELRNAMSLARLWRDQGRVAKVRDLLANFYGAKLLVADLSGAAGDAIA